MKRIIISLCVGVAALASAHPARADETPTKEQLEAAKKAFGDGKALHDQGKLVEAVDKFKESYRLSKNPLLLYNIGLTLDEAGQKDSALIYYRKFLSDAPAAAAQRPAATDRVKALEKEKLDADLNGAGTPTPTPPVDTGPKPDITPPRPDTTAKPVKIKPAGTYSANDFQHQQVDSAPPGKPLDVTAFVPEDSGFAVTLFYRGAGDSAFVAKPMKWRYKELVARIPAATMKGNTIQYYVQVKDQAGTPIGGSGKSVNPNLVTIEAGAPPRFYPDLSDDGSPIAMNPETTKHHDEEDPLHPTKHQVVDDQPKPIDERPTEPAQPGQGYSDVGSSKFSRMKWGSTGVAVALIGTGVATFVLAGKQADNLAADAKMCGMPPCRAFDSYDKDVQAAGQRYQTISNVTFGIGVAAGVVAGYWWYRELTAKKHGDLKATAKTGSSDMTWVVAPSVQDHFTGAAAAVRF